MLITVQEIFFQMIKGNKDKFYLFLIRNLEIIDKLADKQKFAKAIMKKDPIEI